MMSCRIFWNVLALSVGTLGVSFPSSATPEAPLPAAVRQALRQAQVPPSALSALVAPLPDHPGQPVKPRLATRELESVHPASVMKLFTTYAGLQLLGPNHLWRTRIYVDGPVHNGVLQGNLIVRGSGDPKLVVERLQALIAQVMESGVREVRGNILLDRSVFDVPLKQESFDGDTLRPYNVSPESLLVNFKSVIYTFTPDSASGRAAVRTEPPLAGLTVPADVPLRKGPCQDWRSDLKADFSQAQQTRFSGTYPASCGERQWPVAYPSPADYAARVFLAMWQQAGGQLTGEVRDGVTPPRARLLLEAPSLPLVDVIADINKYSNNVMAQQLFLTLSSELGAPGRFEASRLRLNQWWKEQFPQQSAPILDNGSGLSRTERSTAQSLTALLQRASQGAEARAFRDSLSVAGVDGTTARLKERKPNSPVIGKAWLKTGSLRDVVSIAGYVQGDSGQMYTVVAIINHPHAGQARPAIDQLLEWTANDSARLTAQKTAAHGRH